MNSLLSNNPVKKPTISVLSPLYAEEHYKEIGDLKIVEEPKSIYDMYIKVKDKYGKIYFMMLGVYLKKDIVEHLTRFECTIFDLVIRGERRAHPIYVDWPYWKVYLDTPKKRKLK